MPAPRSEPFTDDDVWPTSSVCWQAGSHEGGRTSIQDGAGEHSRRKTCQQTGVGLSRGFEGMGKVTGEVVVPWAVVGSGVASGGSRWPSGGW
jgi:hypothetical protein